MKTKVLLNQTQIRVLLHLVDTMPVTVAKSFGMDQGDISDLFLVLDDADKSNKVN